MVGRVIYSWAYQCPNCNRINKYDFEDCLWALEGEGGLGIECECKFGQVIVTRDLNEAIYLNKDEYIKLVSGLQIHDNRIQKKWTI